MTTSLSVLSVAIPCTGLLRLEIGLLGIYALLKFIIIIVVVVNNNIVIDVDGNNFLL